MGFKDFLKPTKWKLAVFFLIILIVLIAWVESWIFVKDFSKKPFLFDYIPQQVGMASLLITMILTIPIVLLHTLVDNFAYNNFGLLPSELEPISIAINIIGIVYLYFLACFFVWAFEKVKRFKISKKRSA